MTKDDVKAIPAVGVEGGLTAAQVLAEPGRLLDLERADGAAAGRFWNALSREQRLRSVLAAPPASRERLITLAVDAPALVRALAPDEFMASVLEVGPSDAGTLLLHCSDEQLAYLLDLTGWKDERLSPARYEVWPQLLLEAGANRLKRWLEYTDLEVLTLLMAHWVRVVKWLPSQEEQEPPDDLPGFTLDGIYFLEFRDEDLRDFVVQTLVLLQSEMPQRYGEVLEAMLWESASGLAEDAARWRRGRLADLGFPDRLEGLELWSPPRPGEAAWQDLPPKESLGFLADAPPRSDGLIGLLPAEETLPAAAGALDPAQADRFRAELAYVANCGVVALEADPAEPEAVRRAAAESLGLVNLGLELASGGDRARAARILERVGLAALARQGSLALRELNRRAWELVHEGWLKQIPSGLLVLDEPLDHWLAGLVFPRPRCYDPSLPGGVEYRAFRDQADLELAERRLVQAAFWGVLLTDLMGFDLEDVAGLMTGDYLPADPREIKLSTVLGSWLARRALGLTGVGAVPAARLAEAVATLQKGLAGGLDAELMAGLGAVSDPHQAALAGELLRGALARLRAELASLRPESVDPRLISCLVIEP